MKRIIASLLVMVGACGVMSAADERLIRARINGVYSGGANGYDPNSPYRNDREANYYSAMTAPAPAGKCTLEVRVDQVAIVEIWGDQAMLITVQGQPSEWRRMDCTGAIPSNMRDFRFRGVDGRGRQTLVADPRNNRGVAVVRIEDPARGTEGYTFDIEWNGGNGQAPYRYYNGSGQGYESRVGAYPGERRMDERRDERRPGDIYRDRPQERPRTAVVSCISDDGRRHYCDTEVRYGIRLLRELGDTRDARCVRDRTWGTDERGVWVDRGCRAEFEVTLRP